MAARQARSGVLYDGCYAHVISRSIRKIRIFDDNEDFETFRDLLKQVKVKHGFKLYHYCLMQTHFHLVVSMSDMREFSKSVQFLKSQYSYKFHSKYRLSGLIWRERYRSLLIEDERYLKACGEYVENNPVKAGLVEKAEDWAYSSSRHYYKGVSDPLVDEYGGPSKGGIKVEIDLGDEEFFEEGNVIGSAFFRFQFAERAKTH